MQLPGFFRDVKYMAENKGWLNQSKQVMAYIIDGRHLHYATSCKISRQHINFFCSLFLFAGLQLVKILVDKNNVVFV